MGPLLPQPHLLMEIVVKQDQVEVPLQAPQRPLPDTVPPATSLGEGERERGQGAGTERCGCCGHPGPTPGRAGVRPENPQKTILPSFHNAGLLG